MACSILQKGLSVRKNHKKANQQWKQWKILKKNDGGLRRGPAAFGNSDKNSVLKKQKIQKKQK